MIPLTTKYQPNTFDGFAGLDHVKRVFQRLAADPYATSFLLVGDSGTGKTSIALALVGALGAQLHHVTSGDCTIDRVEAIVRSCFYAPLTGGEFHVVLVDEADQMSRAAQVAFLSVLDGSAAPPKTIFIFTANGTKALEARFTSRCKVLHFEGQKHLDAGISFLSRVWAAESADPPPNIAALLHEYRGNIRGVLQALELELMAPTDRPSAASNVTSISTNSRKEITTRMIYTIGTDTLTLARLRAIVSHLSITQMIDCRRQAVAKLGAVPQAKLAEQFGAMYSFEGALLGPKRGGNSTGLEMLTTFFAADAGGATLLLGAPECPGDSHLHYDIALPLRDRGVTVTHICGDELIVAAELQRAIDDDDDYEFSDLALPKGARKAA